MDKFSYLIKVKSPLSLPPATSFLVHTLLLSFPEVTTVTYFVDFLPELSRGVCVC